MKPLESRDYIMLGLAAAGYLALGIGAYIRVVSRLTRIETLLTNGLPSRVKELGKRSHAHGQALQYLIGRADLDIATRARLRDAVAGADEPE